MISVLYPRLLDHAARELHDRHMNSTLDDLRHGFAFSHPAAVFAATGGERVSAERLEDLRDRIVKLAEHAGFPGEGRRRDRMQFDLDVSRLLHERAGLVAAEAAVRPIWAFLALVVLPDVSYWRFPRPPVDRVLATDITRHVWGRLWWRAHLLALPRETGRYDLLDAFGEAAFDQIFARRAMLGGSRSLIRALAQTWPALDRGGLTERELLRDILKRLRRTAAVVEFDALDLEELRTQVTWEAAQSVKALRQAEAPRPRRHVPE